MELRHDAYRNEPRYRHDRRRKPLSDEVVRVAFVVATARILSRPVSNAARALRGSTVSILQFLLLDLHCGGVAIIESLNCVTSALSFGPGVFRIGKSTALSPLLDRFDPVIDH